MSGKDGLAIEVVSHGDDDDDDDVRKQMQRS